MRILRLTEAGLDEAVRSHPLLVVECSDDAEGFARRADAAGAAAAWGHADLREQPALAGLLGVEAPPATLVFREQVVLYRQPRRLDPAELATLVHRVRVLDMDRVRAEIDDLKAAEAALVMRRVCPTARRGRPGD